MTRLAVTARCNAPGCTWQPEGDPDKAAAKHTEDTGHTTVTEGAAVR